MKDTHERIKQYAMKILGAIEETFDEDSENHIDAEVLMQDDNLTEFFHALTTVVPTQIYNGLTNSSEDFLAFNHIANRLIFQYSNKKEA